jgi:hypothetical protein
VTQVLPVIESHAILRSDSRNTDQPCGSGQKQYTLIAQLAELLFSSTRRWPPLTTLITRIYFIKKEAPCMCRLHDSAVMQDVLGDGFRRHGETRDCSIYIARCTIRSTFASRVSTTNTDKSSTYRLASVRGDNGSYGHRHIDFGYYSFDVEEITGEGKQSRLGQFSNMITTFAVTVWTLVHLTKQELV